MRKTAAAQSTENDAGAELATQLEGGPAISTTRAEARPSAGATACCFPTPLASGFVLWTPCIPASDSVHRHLPGSRTPAASPVLVLMFTWLFCTPKNAARYVDLYTRRGWHVLLISSQLLHFLWPPCSRHFAQDVASVLKERCGQYAHTVVHAMSIGAYNYTTCRMMAGDLPDLQTYLFSKLRAVVFDSLTMGSLDHMVRGITMGLSQFGVVQTAARSLANLYFFLTYKTTVQAFDEGIEFFQTNPFPVPTLVLGSEDDPMCDVKVLRSMLHDWTSTAALQVSFKVWERSGHSAHLLHHAEEYQQLLDTFLRSVNLVSWPEARDGKGEGGHPVSKL